MEYRQEERVLGERASVVDGNRAQENVRKMGMRDLDLAGEIVYTASAAGEKMQFTHTLKRKPRRYVVTFNRPSGATVGAPYHTIEDEQAWTGDKITLRFSQPGYYAVEVL